MKVQLSPWRITESSFSFSIDKRRTKSKRQTIDGTPSILASFVVQHQSGSTRSRKRRSGSVVPSERCSLVSLTASHQISVLSESAGDDPSCNGGPGTNEMQFASRPGKSSSFLAQDDTTSVPSLFDDQMKRVYALQKDNSKLVSYPSSNAMGSENESSSSASVALDEPALDMKLVYLPAEKCSVVYGTCMDGKVFVARCMCTQNGQSQLDVHYIGASSQLPADYIGTVATLVKTKQASGEQESAGKRKRTGADNTREKSNIVYIFQITQTQIGVSLIRHKILFQFLNESEQQGAWIVPLQSSIPRDVEFRIPEGAKVGPVSCVGLNTSGGGTECISLKYSYSMEVETRKQAPSQSFIATVSLDTAKSVGTTVALPSNTIDVCCVGSSLLAVMTSGNELVLIDSYRGVHLLRQHLATSIGLQDISYRKLLGEPVSSRLAILFSRGDTLSVASSAIESDDGVNLPRTAPSHKLSDTLEMRETTVRKSPLQSSQTSAVFATPGKPLPERVAIAKGLDVLHEAFNEISESSAKATKPSFLRDAFSTAVRTGSFQKQPFLDSTASPKNGQHCRQNGKKNGTKHCSPKNGSREETGSHNHQTGTAPRIPTGFAGCATQLMVELLSSKTLSTVGTVRNDASFALQLLIQSKNVSARADLCPRSFFCVLRSMGMEATDNKNFVSDYTPFRFINDVLDHCDDVSELQMVAALRYTLIFGNPFEIASFFERLDTGDAASEVYLQRAKRYKESDKKDKEKVTMLLRLSGAAWLFKRYIDLCGCNESLLRYAVSSELSRDECHVALRLISSFLRKHGKSEPMIAVSPGALQWVTALADVAGAHKSSQHLRRTITTQRVHTEVILRTRNLLRQAKESLRSEEDEITTEVAEYQIEHLAF